MKTGTAAQTKSIWNEQHIVGGKSNTAFIFKMAPFIVHSHISLMYAYPRNERYSRGVPYSQQHEQCM